jgi:hypothetical protein
MSLGIKAFEEQTVRKNDDFQLDERVEDNIKRKRTWLRWGLFGANITCFLLYILFIAVSTYNPHAPYSGMLRQWTGFFDPISVLWLVALGIHLASVLIESGHLDRLIASRAQAEEEQIIDGMLDRLAQAEKRKRASSRLNEEFEATTQEFEALSHLEIEEHPRHALL